MINYYEILEVDKNASQEVIEKAYKALAKKYHPDLKQGQTKFESAEKMKIINEAYEILSDTYKRTQYNKKLQQEQLRNQTISKEEQERIIQENYELKQKLNNIARQAQQNQQSVDEGSIINMSRILEQQIRSARKQAYHEPYKQNLQNREYTINFKHDLKYYLKFIAAILIIILACFLIYQIPFVKTFFVNLYNDNIVFQVIVDIFRNTFISSWKF